jgi:hypothetical protein
VKKSDPTKNVIPIPGRVTDDHCDAIAATPKQVEPIANSTPIHHPMRSGRHQTPSRSGCAVRCPRRRRLPAGSSIKARMLAIVVGDGSGFITHIE